MSHHHKIFTHLAILTLFTGCDPDLTAEESEIPTAFDTETTRPTATSEQTSADPGGAALIATISQGDAELRFIDETPDADEPSISLVVIEPDGAVSLLDLLRDESASPLELFMALAPDEEPPLELEIEHVLRQAERDLDLEPRRLSAALQPRNLILAEDDDWGSGCKSHQNWKNGFENWSSAAASTAHINFLHPNQLFGDGIGYFSTNDFIWAGVCIGEYGVSPTSVAIEAWNGSSYQKVANSLGFVPRKDRYLYYSFTSGAPHRRVRVYDTGSPYGNQLFLSGAWRESVVWGKI